MRLSGRRASSEVVKCPPEFDFSEESMPLELPIWLSRIFRPYAAMPPELRRARALLKAIDSGGVPMNPAKINEIARGFGLEVSRMAPIEDTIRRIREAVDRA